MRNCYRYSLDTLETQDDLPAHSPLLRVGNAQADLVQDYTLKSGLYPQATSL